MRQQNGTIRSAKSGVPVALVTWLDMADSGEVEMAQRCQVDGLAVDAVLLIARCNDELLHIGYFGLSDVRKLDQHLGQPGSRDLFQIFRRLKVEQPIVVKMLLSASGRTIPHYRPGPGGASEPHDELAVDGIERAVPSSGRCSEEVSSDCSLSSFPSSSSS